ncbi:hypothetical protein UT300005_17030 [Clostridium sp. CTA-5]
MDRAKTPNKIGELTPQGQWLDNQKAAEFLNDYGEIPYATPPIEIDLPEVIGQVILPSGEIVTATKVRVVVNSKTGKIRSAIPIR